MDRECFLSFLPLVRQTVELTKDIGAGRIPSYTETTCEGLSACAGPYPCTAALPFGGAFRK